ncbi:SPOR domain-containing protein [Candidatus Acidulodesulfobacterium sp. H_13]|uniref:SPOR domain-containing protein n=1 Tax=Candidatus Acidulodesulfobacterium sp. H_13 TaxID=3395470 RepID=UPI003AF40F65
MKKDKFTAVIVFLVILFIVFVFGLFVGRKLSPKNSKEGTIKESALKSELKISNLQRNNKKPPVSVGGIKFAPISKLVSLKKGNVPVSVKKTSPIAKPKAAKVKIKIVYVKKPVYIYKYKTKNRKVLLKRGRVSHVGSKIYTIQVAALSKYSEAKAFADKLDAMGFFAYVLPVKISGKSGKIIYQQVRVGKFSTLKGAESIESIISKKFKVKPYIITVH